MKKFVLFVLFGFSLISFNGCNGGNIIPIVQDICEVTSDICNYANLLCSNFVPENMTKSEQDKVLNELSRIKDQLKTQLEIMDIQASDKIQSNKKYAELLNKLKESVNKITDKQTEFANE